MMLAINNDQYHYTVATTVNRLTSQLRSLVALQEKGEGRIAVIQIAGVAAGRIIGYRKLHSYGSRARSARQPRISAEEVVP